MKKTISINIGGNIFHIEEEGYEKLKAYLDSVHKYFSTFEDAKEITDDIENRIAEKFYSQLKKNKEAISTKEVDQLIASMGTVADFEATFEDEPKDQKLEPKTSEAKDTTAEGASAARKLYRDTKHKILGGVAAGFANYFNVDPLWFRLLWIVFFFSGVGIIAYIIFWIVLPGHEVLEEKKSVKKFYRDPDKRVLGGVASGIANYFGSDLVVFRLLFFISIFLGGSGIIVYIILWIITPEAKSVTEKMEMKGEPVTMAGIEKNVKKSLNMEEKEENVFVKILLFPFRLVAMLFEGLGRMLGPVMTFIIETVRVVFGAFVFLTGFSIMIFLIFSLFFLLGMDWHMGDRMATIDGIPLADFIAPMGPLATASVFLLGFIPALGVALLGLTILLKKRIGNAYVALSLVVIWVVAVIGASFTVPQIINQFSTDDTIEEQITFKMGKEEPVLKLNFVEDEPYDYRGVNLRLRGHADTTFLLVMDKEGRGSSRSNARENAAGVSYTVTQVGNDLVFDSRIKFNDDTKFRFQNVDATLYIPYGRTFKMEQELDEILINTLHINGYYGYQMGDNTWMFDEDGIICLTCSATRDRLGNAKSDRKGRSFDFEGFNEVSVSSAFKVKVIKSDDFDVMLSGRRGDLDRVIIKQVNERLTIQYDDEEDEWDNRSRDITVSLYLPELAYFKASGECSGSIADFDQKDMELVLSGDTDFKADLTVQALKVDMSGGAELTLSGSADLLTAEISGATSLESTDMDANEVTLDASGSSSAGIFADDQLKVNATGNSQVTYRGTSQTEITTSDGSRVRKD